MVPLKLLKYFCKTVEATLTNYETNLILTWFVNYFIIDASPDNYIPTFKVTDKNFMLQL